MPITINGSGTVTGASTLATTVASPTFTTPNIDSAQVATVSGTAPLYMCRAWVNFNGTGTVAIRASGNVTSITDDGTGTYTVNFTTAMPDTNYAAAVSVAETGSTGLTDWSGAIRRNTNASDSMATTFIKVAAFSAGSVAVDPGVVVVTIFR